MVVSLVALGGIGGVCKGGRILFRGLSLRVRGKRFIKLMKEDNTNGAALLGVVKLVASVSTKAVAVSNRRGISVGDGSTVVLEECAVNCLFRGCKLVRSRDIL